MHKQRNIKRKTYKKTSEKLASQKFFLLNLFKICNAYLGRYITIVTNYFLTLNSLACLVQLLTSVVANLASALVNISFNFLAVCLLKSA